MFDFIEYQDIPMYGILGGIAFVFFVAFTIMWVWEELVNDAHY